MTKFLSRNAGRWRGRGRGRRKRGAFPRSAHRIDAWRGSRRGEKEKENPSPLDRGESLQEDGTISQRRKGRMELAYFDTETPYIKFQSSRT